MKFEKKKSDVTHKRQTRKRRHYIEKDKDSFLEFTQWTKSMKRPCKGKLYTELQIDQIKEFIELTQGINLSKKHYGNQYITLSCNNFKVCSYFYQFQRCTNKKTSKVVSCYKIIRSPNFHQASSNSQCFLTNQELILAQRKKYLTLIGPIIKRILTSEDCEPQLKNPTWIKKQLENFKKQKPDYIYKGLAFEFKRKLKKALDNTIGKIKHEINNQASTKTTLKMESKVQKLSNLKKKKIFKEKGSLLYKKRINHSKVQASKNQALELMALGEKYHNLNQANKESILPLRQIDDFDCENSPNLSQKYCEAIKLEDVCLENNEKFKEQFNAFLSPVRINQKIKFCLQKSAQKCPDTFEKSHQKKLFNHSFENGIKNNSDQEGKVSARVPEISHKKQKRRRIQILNYSSENEVSGSENDSKGSKKCLISESNENKLKKQQIESFQLELI